MAGEGLPPSKLLTGPSVSPAVSLRAGDNVFILPQTDKGRTRHVKQTTF